MILCILFHLFHERQLKWVHHCQINYYIMRRKTLAREFLQLSKYDFLTVAALRLRDRPSIRRIVERIEALSPKFTDLFSPSELWTLWRRVSTKTAPENVTQSRRTIQMLKNSEHYSNASKEAPLSKMRLSLFWVCM